MARWSRRHVRSDFTESHVKWDSRDPWRYEARTIQSKRRKEQALEGENFEMFEAVWLECMEEGKNGVKWALKDHEDLADMVRDLDFILNITGSHSRVLTRKLHGHFDYRTILKVGRRGSLRVHSSPGDRWLMASGTTYCSCTGSVAKWS